MNSQYKSECEQTTTCDICGKEIIGIENFINAGDKVVCSEKCLQQAIGDYFIKNSLTYEEKSGMISHIKKSNF